MTNTCPSVKIGVFGNVFGVVVNMSDYGAKPLPPDCCSYTFTEIQKWIHNHHKVLVSKSSISSVKSKCGIFKSENNGDGNGYGKNKSYWSQISVVIISFMVLFVDETENTEYFIVTGLLVNSQQDINSAYRRFKKKARNINVSPKKKSQLFTEFKSNLMDRNYQKLKISMLSELNSIEHYIIYSCYIKKDHVFRQALKEDVYIKLLTKIVESLSSSVDIIFDAFNKSDFENKIVSSILSLSTVISIESCDSQKNPGLQFVDNLSSVCRLNLDNNDPHEFFKIIKENVREV